MFEQLQAVPADPLLGIIARYQQDTRLNKIDLGVGVYKTDDNRTPVLECVKAAEAFLVKHQTSKAYLGPKGDAAFTEQLNQVLFGESLYPQLSGRLAALQTPGGCGALRTAAELIKRAKPGASIWVSDPTWANHQPLLGGAGIQIQSYPYYDFAKKSLDFEGMCAQLNQIPAGDIVLLHGCCHNPCGADLSPAQWDHIVSLLEERNLVPFVDMAYQGFGDGLEEDAYGIRKVFELLPEVIFTVSCSKNFGLYRDRVGVVGFLVEDASRAGIVSSHLAQIVRGIYSMPPDHGAAVVSHILQSSELRTQWEQELREMRERIQAMRAALAEGLRAQGFAEQFDFVEQEKGMFSFLGITQAQVARMAEEHGAYMADSSRINVAGLNSGNINGFVEALTKILRA